MKIYKYLSGQLLLVGTIVVLIFYLLTEVYLTPVEELPLLVAIVGILEVFALLATLFYFYTQGMISSSEHKEMLNEMRKQYIPIVRLRNPEVVRSPSSPNKVKFRVKNIGLGPAIDIKVKYKLLKNSEEKTLRVPDLASLEVGYSDTFEYTVAPDMTCYVEYYDLGGKIRKSDIQKFPDFPTDFMLEFFNIPKSV